MYGLPTPPGTAMRQEKRCKYLDGKKKFCHYGCDKEWRYFVCHKFCRDECFRPERECKYIHVRPWWYTQRWTPYVRMATPEEHVAFMEEVRAAEREVPMPPPPFSNTESAPEPPMKQETEPDEHMVFMDDVSSFCVGTSENSEIPNWDQWVLPPCPQATSSWASSTTSRRWGR